MAIIYMTNSPLPCEIKKERTDLGPEKHYDAIIDYLDGEKDNIILVEFDKSGLIGERYENIWNSKDYSINYRVILESSNLKGKSVLGYTNKKVTVLHREDGPARIVLYNSKKEEEFFVAGEKCVSSKNYLETLSIFYKDLKNINSNCNIKRKTKQI